MPAIWSQPFMPLPDDGRARPAYTGSRRQGHAAEAMMTAAGEIGAAKAALRAASLARRDALDPAARAAASAAIADAILKLDLAAGAAVSAFLPIRSEVDLRPAIAGLTAAGHPVGLPIMRKPDLIFRRWAPGELLVPLGFGTEGPPPEAPEIVPALMLVPLSVFDRQLNRIGYGKAFYDITIARLRAEGHRPRLVGVAFGVQEAERVPVEPHDVPLDMVITEVGTITA